MRANDRYTQPSDPKSRDHACGEDDVIIWDDLPGGSPRSSETLERLRSYVDKQVSEGHLVIGQTEFYDEDDLSW